jgi:hypothetical protein
MVALSLSATLLLTCVVPSQAAGGPCAQAVAPASATTLADALRGLAAVLPLDIRLDPAVARVVVEADVAGVPSEVALRRVLMASGVDFVIGRRGDRLVVVAGNASEAQPFDIEPDRARAEGVPGEDSGDVAKREAPAEEPDTDAPPSVAPADETAGARAPGEVTAQELAALLSASPKVDRTAPGWVELPFPDENGQPVRVWRPGGNPGIVELPFPDESGQPLTQQVPARPLGFVELPFPDEHGRPIRVVTPPASVPAPATSPVPGVVPGAKPPGEVR